MDYHTVWPISLLLDCAQLLVAPEIPDKNRLIAAARNHRLRVSAHIKIEDHIRVSDQVGHFLVCREPHEFDLLRKAAVHLVEVRTPLLLAIVDAPDMGAVLRDGSDILSRGHAPDSQGSIQAAGEQVLPVLGQSQAGDFTVVSLKFSLNVPVLEIPNIDAIITAASNQLLAALADQDLSDGALLLL